MESICFGHLRWEDGIVCGSVAHIFDAGRFLCRGFLARLRIYPTITFLVRALWLVALARGW